MTGEPEIRRRLTEWIVRKSGKVRAEEVAGDTPIIERRIITSLQIPDLILFIEELSGREIDPARLRPGVFRDIDAIVQGFFAP